jgi:hypothetical protein
MPKEGTRPKIEGKRSRRPASRAGPIWKEYDSKVVGLESHMLDVGNVKHAAKF